MRGYLIAQAGKRIHPDIPIISSAHYAISKDVNITARPREITDPVYGLAGTCTVSGLGADIDQARQGAIIDQSNCIMSLLSCCIPESDDLRREF